MKALLLIACALSLANSRPPAVAIPQVPIERREVSRTDRIIDGGRRREFRIRYDDGAVKRFIFELTPVGLRP